MPSFSKQLKAYHENGWCLFEHDPELLEWTQQTLQAARETVSRQENQQWLRHGGTWFAGVNVLENNSLGAVANGPVLTARALDFIQQHIIDGPIGLDKAQISVCYPGYPQPSSEENDAAFAYRLKRDAAHIDGVLREGQDQQRYLREYHDYILAIPMVEFDIGAAPFVVWSGSHKIIRKGFQAALAGVKIESWSDFPIREDYQALRKTVFANCQRVEVSLKPGQALVAHRLLLHGTAPWQENAVAGDDGRVICFFRPANLTIEQWLSE